MDAEVVAERLRASGSVFADEEAALLVAAGARDGKLEELVRRREAGEPLEVLLGWVEFAGRRLEVDAGVFVPRRRTELLADLAVRALPRGGTAVDLCCGVGAVAVALLDAVDAADPVRPEVHAVDIDPRAAGVARRNLAGRAEVHVGDLWAALPARLRGRVDVVAVNAPYVPTGHLALLPPEARLHEPLAALDGGPDGVALHRRVAAGAPRWLAPGGTLLVETSEAQAELTTDVLARAGLTTEAVADDELGALVVRGVLAAGIRPGEPGW